METVSPNSRHCRQRPDLRAKCCSPGLANVLFTNTLPRVRLTSRRGTRHAPSRPILRATSPRAGAYSRPSTCCSDIVPRRPRQLQLARVIASSGVVNTFGSRRSPGRGRVRLALRARLMPVTTKYTAEAVDAVAELHLTAPEAHGVCMSCEFAWEDLTSRKYRSLQ